MKPSSADGLSRVGRCERANYQMFLSELCDVSRVPARTLRAGARCSDYVFERAVRPRDGEGRRRPSASTSTRRTPSSWRPSSRAWQGPTAPVARACLGKRNIARGWDVMMKNARRQAELTSSCSTPIIPRRPSSSCAMSAIASSFCRLHGHRARLRPFPGPSTASASISRICATRSCAPGSCKIWPDPHSLDPSRESARVTRAIARRLAQVGKAWRSAGATRGCGAFPDAVPVHDVRQGCRASPPPDSFKTMLGRASTTRGISRTGSRPSGARWKPGRVQPRGRGPRAALQRRPVQRHHGVPARPRGDRRAARCRQDHDWTDVDPAIFGTLLEQALDPGEQGVKLGAHYRPAPMSSVWWRRPSWSPCARTGRSPCARPSARSRDPATRARPRAMVRAFHRPAVCHACARPSLRHRELPLRRAGADEEARRRGAGDAGDTRRQEMHGARPGDRRSAPVPGPRAQPRAAAIARVVWIGYLQWHFRTAPATPPSRSCAPSTTSISATAMTGRGAHLERLARAHRAGGCRGPARSDLSQCSEAGWPEAEFIVGNPPFLGPGEAIRGGDG